MSTAPLLSPQLAAARPAVNPWLITIAVMLGTFMEVLDTSVANVALPHIAGSLSVTPNEATWVLTSYLVSNAIVLPMTGWLSRVFGRKNFLVACIALFTTASFLCGMAPTLGFLIAARILQGVGGGALQPIAQAILLESFPMHKRGQAMAAYTLGIVFAPIIGPTVGGWITDNYSWRWIFYINIPIGILAMTMVQSLIVDPAYIRNAKAGRVDYWGFGLLALWIGTLQVVLDKGEQVDWLGAPWVRWSLLVTGLAFVAFIVRELMAEHPLVDLRVLKDRNFATGTLLVTIVGLVLYGTTALLPLLLQTLLGYPALQAGLALSPRGIGSIFAILIAARLVMYIDMRILMVVAFGLLAYSSFLLGKVDMDITSMSVTWPIIINGAAVSLLFMPLTIYATATLRNEELGNATGIYNLMRNIGGSLGISMMMTLLSRSSQTYQNVLAGHVTEYSPIARARLQTLTHALSSDMDPAAAALRARAILYNTVQQQAHLHSYIHDFRLMAWVCVGCIPLVFLFKKAHTQHKRGAIEAH